MELKMEMGDFDITEEDLEHLIADFKDAFRAGESFLGTYSTGMLRLGFLID